MPPYPFSYSTDPHIDLSSLDAFSEGAPFASFERMRLEDPMAWCEEADGRGFWSVTRHADLLSLNRQTDLLSSARGIRIDDQSDDEYEARKTFQETDPPLHTAFRKLVNAAFSRPEMMKYERQIRDITRQLLDRALQAGSFDATALIARQLPMRMLGLIMGVPPEDADWLVEKGDALISNSDPEFTDFVVDKIDTGQYRLLPFQSPVAIELFDYADHLLKRMAKGEKFGVLNQVTQSEASGQGLSDDEFRNFFCLMVAAGNDTTRYAIAASIHALANQPGLLEEIRRNHQKTDFMIAATDEMIRYASPTTHFRRTATRAFEHRGKTVRKGDKVVLWFVSGNRDDEVFKNPHALDLSRKPNRFLSFGQGGPHVCLGMWLAKLEVRVVLDELARSARSIEQTDRHEYLRSNFILGIKRLPIRIEAR